MPAPDMMRGKLQRSSDSVDSLRISSQLKALSEQLRSNEARASRKPCFIYLAGRNLKKLSITSCHKKSVEARVSSSLHSDTSRVGIMHQRVYSTRRLSKSLSMVNLSLGITRN